MARNPKAKIFIYAGYDHAKKWPASTADDDSSWLAAQLLRLTGINPLTVNQTTLYAHIESPRQALYYKHAAMKLAGRNPQVLMSPRGKPVQLGLNQFCVRF